MAEPVLLCKLDDLEDGVPREVHRELEASELHLVVGRLGDRVYAYDNVCPHQGRPMNWAPGRFLVQDGQRLVCAHHGATFELSDGSCVGGPCQGVGLRPAEIEVRDGRVYLLR